MTAYIETHRPQDGRRLVVRAGARIETSGAASTRLGQSVTSAASGLFTFGPMHLLECSSGDVSVVMGALEDGPSNSPTAFASELAPRAGARIETIVGPRTSGDR